MVRLKSQFWRLSRTDLIIFNFAWICVLAVFAPHISMIDFGVDEEVALNRLMEELNTDAGFASGSIDWITQGRFTMFAVERLLAAVSVVGADVILGSAALIASIFIILRAHPKLQMHVKILVLMGILLNPVILYTLEFKMNFVGFCVGILFTTLAAYVDDLIETNASRFWVGLCQVAFLAIAVGAYQSLIIVFVLHAIIIVSQKVDLSNADVVKQYVRYALLTLAGLAGYYIIQYSLLNILHLKIEYIGFFLTFQILSDYQYVLSRAFESITAAYGDAFWLVSILYGFAIIAMLLRMRAQSLMSKILNGLAVLSLFWFPMVLNLIGSGVLPVRTMVGCLFVPAFAFLVIHLMEAPVFLRRSSNVLMTALVLVFIVEAGQFNRNHNLRQDYDRFLATQVFQGIVSHPEYDADKEYRIKFLGSIAYAPLTLVENVYSASYNSLFSWGDPIERRYRSAYYMRGLGLMPTNVIDVDTTSYVTEEIKAQLSFPQKGFVDISDDVVIVKWSEPINLDNR